MKTPDSFELETNLRPGEYLQDYLNELYNFMIDRDGTFHKLGDMKTVEERFAGMTGAFAEGTKRDMDENPEKVAAINELAKKFNAISTAEEYKVLERELIALLRS